MENLKLSIENIISESKTNNQSIMFVVDTIDDMKYKYDSDLKTEPSKPKEPYTAEEYAEYEKKLAEITLSNNKNIEHIELIDAMIESYIIEASRVVEVVPEKYLKGVLKKAIYLNDSYKEMLKYLESVVEIFDV